ncbi:cellulose-binding protein [Streptomyces sp. V2]|uniref:cellulose-binding domain-containing protein n=1 Tax=unclassified Streptomyces TaxID=2593676 RepID=UPI000D66FAE5|nr:MULTISPECIES: cellulose-binding domain-containing protein [unclassified Streptomyces]PWG07103.1 cellulose-binding protein [Streptomyces sp. V2]QZZ30977.1 cellulose-binding protein [Streptomyces sp. ST1015]
MPDLPTPKDAAEAALFSECWDAVLSYADLCTAGSTAAHQLAREAFALGIREARAAEDGTRSMGRRSARLPRIPLLLTAVRTTAAGWEAGGHGHRLDPDLRLWLNSDKAARYTGPPLSRPIALRGLRDMQEPDAALLWLAEVEALPLRAVARRLGLDPQDAAEQLGEVRGLFRDRCHRNHLDTPLDAECRSYVRLLDAVTRSTTADTPEDLSRHLATCVECAEAAACLRLHGGGLPAALAGGVIGWGGLAYLERRRRAAEVRLGAGRPDLNDPESEAAQAAAAKAKALRGGLLVAAVLVSVLALGVSLMPFGGGDTRDEKASRGTPTDSTPVVGGVGGVPSFETPTPKSDSPSPSGADGRTDPEPQGTSSAAASPSPSSPDSGTGGAGGASGSGDGGALCAVTYDLVNQWPDGFQATVTVTTVEKLTDWHVSWSFKDGQHVDQMWDASVAQMGSRVIATAADYNKSVAEGGTLSFGFLASWEGKNTAPYGFTLNGHPCD